MICSRTSIAGLIFQKKYLLECVQRGQNGASDPGAVFTLWRSRDLDLDILQG